MKKLMLKMMVAMVLSGFMVAPAVFADQRNLITNRACSIIDNSNPNVVSQPVNDNVPGCGTSTPGVADKGGLAFEIVNSFMYIAGIVAFIFMIIGGIRYITSDGDASRVQAAKQTLLYAIIGLIITLIAAAIAGFVIKTVVGG